MTGHQTHTADMPIVADALAAAPEVTNLTHAREECHSDVQFHCRIDGEPTDVTVLPNGVTPPKAVQTAYFGTTRDSNHCIITPDKRTATRIRRWLQAPVADASTDAIQLYTHNQLLTNDGAVAVTAAETEAPTWVIRGTDAGTDRDRRCELKHTSRVLATYDLERGTVTLEGDRWVDIERCNGEQPQSAIAPETEYQSLPQPNRWQPVGLPLCVPSTIALAESSVYTLAQAPETGVVPVNTTPLAPADDDQSVRERAKLITDRLLFELTVESPTATIAYDDLKAVFLDHARTHGWSISSAVFNELLHSAGVTIKRGSQTGHRQVRGRAWTVPPSTSIDRAGSALANSPSSTG